MRKGLGVERVTADNFVTGIFGVLAKRGYTKVSIRTDMLDEAMAKAFTRLAERAKASDLDLRFRVNRDLYGTSPVIRTAISRAAQRDLISLDNPEYQDIRFTANARSLDLDHLPGGSAMYKELADVFIASYEARTPTPA